MMRGSRESSGARKRRGTAAFAVPRLALLVLLAGLCVTSCQKPPARKPNVVVFVIDTLRADRLHCYGGPRDTSPAIDELARAGVLFEQAVSAAPRTWQSFCSILTGLYPVHHGVRYIFDQPLSPRIGTLASWLREAGYRTAAFDGMNFLRGMTGGKAFDDYVDPTALARPVLPGDILISSFLAWVEKGPRPFFAFLRLGGPHWPYACLPWYHDRSVNDAAIDHSFNSGGYGIGIARAGRGLKLIDKEAYRRRYFEADLKPDVRQHMILHYDECVRANDELVGRALDRMRARGLFEESLVIVTADHGESFGEHGYMEHGPRVDEPVMHVPLIIRLPSGFEQRWPGRRVAQMVRTVDIAPTVLDAVGLEIPAGLDGVSLMGLLGGEVNAGLVAYGESGQDFVGVDPQLFLPGVRGKHRMLRTQKWKLVYVPDQGGGKYSLYDLDRDPDEDTDVASSHPEIVAKLSGQLKVLIAKDGRVRKQQGVLTKKQIEQLKALGYM